MSKKKKVIILSCLIALLVTTAVLNFALSSSITSANGDVAPTASYFTEVRTTRNSSRNQQLAQINEIIASSEDGSEEKKEAMAMKIKLTTIMEQENLLENLIKAKGYEEVAVTIGMTSDNVSIIVKDSNFDQDDAVLIYSICSDEINATPDNVYIQAIS